MGRERARERASFLAESGTLLDRGTTSDEVLDTFAGLAIERGNDYCVAEELASPGAALPELELGRVTAGDAAVMPPGDWPAAEAAWEEVETCRADGVGHVGARGGRRLRRGSRCTCSRSRPWPAAA